MGFDAHSLERLRELGRRLPQRLPEPSSASPTPAAPPASGPQPRRHRLETETDPEQLFRELMAASPDGTVPPHLLDRLRDLEGQRRSAAAAAATPTDTHRRSTAAPGSRSARREKGARQANGRQDSARPGAEADLYTSFQQLLLEEEDG